MNDEADSDSAPPHTRRTQRSTTIRQAARSRLGTSAPAPSTRFGPLWSTSRPESPGRFLETIDLAPDRGRSEPEWNFGLLRNDSSSKPEYTALKNLLAAIGTGAPAALEPLKLSIESGPDDFRTLVLQRADGSYLIALWRLTSVWDRHASTPIAVPPQRVKLSLPDARSVGPIAPMASTSETALPLSHSRVVVDVAGDPLVLRVLPETGCSAPCAG
jgi:hypothetical protein